MRVAAGVEWAIHCCSLLAGIDDHEVLPGATLAELYELPPAYLAKQLQALSVTGIVDTTRGPAGGYRLARPAAEITMLDIVRAIEGEGRGFRCTEIRRRGQTAIDDDGAYPEPCGIAQHMWKAEDAWAAHLASVTVADLQRGAAEAVDRRQRELIDDWVAVNVRRRERMTG